MKQRVAEMEREASKLRELQAAAAEQSAQSGDDGSVVENEEDKAAADGRSVYVGNVNFIDLQTCFNFTNPVYTGGLRSHS